MAGVPGAADRWASGYPTDGDVLAARRYLDVCADTGDPHPFGDFEIRLREDGRAIGGAGFHGAADENGCVTIGYGLVPSARGSATPPRPCAHCCASPARTAPPASGATPTTTTSRPTAS
uniref:Acetyltransferase n=1 Tax=Streptomyces garyphalus TaxID=235466 RepID=Q768T9_9ACTN|nr:hypothetical protein [Streptomyces garyphalus]